MSALNSPIHPYHPPIASKICPSCLQQFDGYVGKVYCSIRCRTAAKTKRAIERDKAAGLVGPRTPQDVKRQVGAEIILENATTAQMDEYAGKLVSGVITTPVRVTGIIPVWEPTDAQILFAKQQGIEPEEYFLMTEKMLDSM